jgi:hypothetical protein
LADAHHEKISVAEKITDYTIATAIACSFSAINYFFPTPLDFYLPSEMLRLTQILVVFGVFCIDF